MEMIETLKRIERDILPSLLSVDEDGEWHSLDINYLPPHVERLWRQVDRNWRILLHMIHPCVEGEEFYHPHPWPSAVHTHSQYVMRSGAGPHDGPDPAVTLEQIIEPGSYYQMPSMDSWHSVRVLGDKVGFSTMLIGQPWYVIPSQHLELGEIKPEQKCNILGLFRGIHGIR